jgi:hypothetical protein
MGFNSAFKGLIYCHLWPVRLYYIFLHYLLNSAIIKNIKYKMCLAFLYNLQLQRCVLCMIKLHFYICIFIWESQRQASQAYLRK